MSLTPHLLSRCDQCMKLNNPLAQFSSIYNLNCHDSYEVWLSDWIGVFLTRCHSAMKDRV